LFSKLLLELAPKKYLKEAKKKRLFEKKKESFSVSMG